MNLRIRDLREDHDLTQSQVAKILGCTQQTYSRYENGKLNFPSVLIPELCYFLGMTPNDLFEYERYLKIYHSKEKNK